MSEKSEIKPKKKHTVQYDRWGYFFIAPFFIIYIIFSLIPLLSTFYNTFFENYRVGTEQEGPFVKVPKYFNGRQKFYEKEIEDVVVFLTEKEAAVEESETVDGILVASVKAAIDEKAGHIDTERFDVAYDKLVSESEGKSAKAFIKAASDLVSCRESAFVKNFRKVFSSDILKYTLNTLIMWIMGFVPQIVISLVLSVWFTNTELKLKFQQFFKTVIYMPNLIMASAFSMLFFTLFSDKGPINSIFIRLHWMDPENPMRYFISTGWTRSLVAAMNFLMWYGNTTILLMAGIMGIDESLFEAARIDGASPTQVFFKVTMPLLMPIFVYVFITSMIGGIQMFDVPQILSNGMGTPNNTTMTLIMYLNRNLTSKNYGVSGAISVLLFIITGILSAIVYRSNMKQYSGKGR